EQSTKNYTIEADVMSDGNRRVMSDVGVINQRYLIVLKGNEQKLEINSNLERLRVPASTAEPNFKWVPKVWYRHKARVDVAADGSGMVRAKAWKKEEPEPEKWSLEVPHQHAHETSSTALASLDLRPQFSCRGLAGLGWQRPWPQHVCTRQGAARPLLQTDRQRQNRIQTWNGRS